MGLGHFYRRRARAACGRDDDRRYPRVSLSTQAARNPHVALLRRAPRPKQSHQRLLPLVPRPKGRQPWNRLGVADEHLRAVLEIKEVRGLGGEVHEDVLVGRGTPYVCRQERERAVGRQDWRWCGGGHGQGAVKDVRPAVRTGLSALGRRGGRSAARLKSVKRQGWAREWSGSGASVSGQWAVARPGEAQWSGAGMGICMDGGCCCYGFSMPSEHVEVLR